MTHVTLAPTGPFSQNPQVVMRDMDDAVFLVNPDTDAIYQLNATGSAVWRLMAEPATAREAVAVLGQAFPEVPEKELATAVAELIADLVGRGLLVAAD